MTIPKYFTYFIIIIGLISGWFATSGKKSQFIRLLDIFYIGPLMIYLSIVFLYIKTNNINYLLICSLIYFGATTISYNLKNFIFLIE